LALEPLATAEAAVADEVLGLADEDRLAVVLGRAPEGADAEVVPDVHRLTLEEVAAALQSVPEDRRVVVAGDDALLPGPAPGAVLADLVAWGRVPVHDLRDAGAGSASDALGRLPAALRRGELPEPDPDDRSVVVVPCGSDDDVVRRAVQVVSDSLPRVFGIAPTDVLAVAALRRGEAGVTALEAALAEAAPGVRVSTVHDAAGGPTAAAVVACFAAQAAGALTRPMVATCAALADRQLSVVTAAGDALPRVVRDGVGRPRRTRLLHLLRTASREDAPA
jgi:hypothetical protein